ncbi:MAG TPA: UDP-N-acetylmuramate dehydrogenase, partial [Candidatus Caenarcaniphilales bacterium]
MTSEVPTTTGQPAIPLAGTPCLIRPQVSLSHFTSFRVGGPAEWFVAPQHLEELQASFEWAKVQGLPITVLGAGSNLLVSDRGLPGLTVCTRHLRHLDFNAVTGQVTVGAGEPIPRVAWQVAARGWSGLEWAVGIPGSVGGAVVMNAGAHGQATADQLVEIQVLEPDGTLKTLRPTDLGYRYRTSILQDSNLVVVQATLQLQLGAEPAQVSALTTEHLNQRRATQPYHLPSCGSVFRNPLPRTAGWLIEQTGLKGYQMGGAKVAQLHANFILNCGHATATDIYQLIGYIQHQVEQRWSLRLRPEVKILG